MTKSEYWTDFWINHGKENSHLSKSQNQVCRTVHGKAIDEETFDVIVKSIIDKLSLEKDDKLLDLCCGNGLITEKLSKMVDSVIAVDCSSDLLEQIDIVQYSNINTYTANITEIDFDEKRFDKILIYAGIQYFSEGEIIKIIRKCFDLLSPKGSLFIGDIPDRTRIWNFYNTPERENAYFSSISQEKPIIGTWIEPEWMVKLGNYIGYKQVSVYPQSLNLPYAHYRFDVIYQR